MKPLHKYRSRPSSLSILADEVIEFHAARLLLLFELFSEDGGIDGLTKMAKLDFFVRYPQFFTSACHTLGKKTKSITTSVESSMIRYHYGPWDNRYYQVLAYLEARGLIHSERTGNKFQLSTTQLGAEIAKKLEQDGAYAQIINQMQLVKDVLGKMNGSQLKKLIYRVFDEQVTKLSLGEVIKP